MYAGFATLSVVSVWPRPKLQSQLPPSPPYRCVMLVHHGGPLQQPPLRLQIPDLTLSTVNCLHGPTTGHREGGGQGVERIVGQGTGQGGDRSYTGRGYGEGVQGEGWYRERVPGGGTGSREGYRERGTGRGSREGVQGV